MRNPSAYTNVPTQISKADLGAIRKVGLASRGFGLIIRGDLVSPMIVRLGKHSPTKLQCAQYHRLVLIDRSNQLPTRISLSEYKVARGEVYTEDWLARVQQSYYST